MSSQCFYRFPADQTDPENTLKRKGTGRVAKVKPSTPVGDNDDDDDDDDNESEDAEETRHVKYVLATIIAEQLTQNCFVERREADLTS